MNAGLRGLGTRMLPPKEGMHVLDIGCGTGAHLNHYKKTGCHLYGIDSSKSMLEIARKRLGDGAMLTLGDATNLPYDNNHFDLVLCMLVLHEMDHPVRLSVLSEMKRVCKPDGYILLIDFHAGPARPPKGWLMKPIIYLSELAAGWKHFRNYRHFIAIQGLPALINETKLITRQQKVVSGGAMALYLVQPD